MIVSVVIVAIVAAGVGTYLYITYSQKPTQQTTNVITNKTFTLASLDPRSLITYAPYAYVIQNGYLQKYAPNVNVVLYIGSGDVVKAIESGQAQFGILPTLYAIQAIAANAPITIITFLSIPYTIVVAVNPNSNITNPSQLKGKTFVATTPFGPQDLFLRLFLKNMNWTLNDVKIVYVGADIPATYAAVATGKADAVTTYYLSAFTAIKKGLIKPIYFFNESWPSYVLVGDKNYIIQNPDTVKAVLKGLSEGFAAYDANNDNSSINFIINMYKGLNLTIGEAKTIWKLSQQYINFTISVNLLDEALKFLQSSGAVSKNITVDMLYTKEFVPVVNVTS